MKRLFLSLLAATLGVGCLPAQSGGVPALASEALAAAGEGALAVPGKDPSWIFGAPELRHLAQGAFWDPWKAGATDPVPEIARYAAELKGLGVELLLVPVPPKAALYPEEFGGPGTTPVSSLPFLKQLSDSGVQVLDLEKLLGEAKAAGTRVYCEQDSHWTPEACQLVAHAIAEGYRGADWLGDPAQFTKTEPETLSVHGDLVGDAQKATLPREDLAITYVGLAGADAAGKPEPVKVDPASPLLLLGDSHTLVFSEGPSTGMHSFGGGLFDHLALEFGLAPDRSANKGSGTGTARSDLARRAYKDPAFWADRELVIWVFTAREFTEGTWREIPAQPKKK